MLARKLYFPPNLWTWWKYFIMIWVLCKQIHTNCHINPLNTDKTFGECLLNFYFSWKNNLARVSFSLKFPPWTFYSHSFKKEFLSESLELCHTPSNLIYILENWQSIFPFIRIDVSIINKYPGFQWIGKHEMLVQWRHLIGHLHSVKQLSKYP